MIKQLKKLIGTSPERCETCDVSLQLTGEQPANRAEEAVKKIVGERQSVSLRWLEEQLSHALFREELGHNAWAIDIGILDPACFGPEVARILSDIRPQFARIAKEGESATVTPRAALKKVAAGRPLYGDC